MTEKKENMAKDMLQCKFQTAAITYWLQSFIANETKLN